MTYGEMIKGVLGDLGYPDTTHIMQEMQQDKTCPMVEHVDAEIPMGEETKEARRFLIAFIETFDSMNAWRKD